MLLKHIHEEYEAGLGEACGHSQSFSARAELESQKIYLKTKLEVVTWLLKTHHT